MLDHKSPGLLQLDIDPDLGAALVLNGSLLIFFPRRLLGEAAGKWTETGESFHAEEVVDWIESDIKGERNFALRAKGDSMESELN